MDLWVGLFNISIVIRNIDLWIFMGDLFFFLCVCVRWDRGGINLEERGDGVVFGKSEGVEIEVGI